MRILTNTTSPYARIARIGLAEKGHDIAAAEAFVNPWNDDPALREQNSAARVPAIVTDSGIALTESLLILMWLEKIHPEPSLTDGDIEPMFHRAGVAMGVIDAMINLLATIMHHDADFAEHPVGKRRRRSLAEGLEQLENDPPEWLGGTPDIALITTVVARDYAMFRFADKNWFAATPKLDALSDALGARESFAHTRPYTPAS